MSSSRSQATEENTRSGNRSPSQYTFHLRNKSHSSPSPHSSGASPKRSSIQSHTSHTVNPSPLKMVTTTSASHHSSQGASGYYMAPDATSQAYGWMVPTVIEDEDLMFGGKSLSAWHEEDRCKTSYPEEERRGRQRVRQYHSYSGNSSKSKTTSMGEQKKH